MLQRDTRSSFYGSMDAYATRQRNYHYIYYNATTIAIPKGCPTSTAPENACLSRKGPRRCMNRLVVPYSYVWTVCRTVNTHPNTTASGI